METEGENEKPKLFVLIRIEDRHVSEESCGSKHQVLTLMTPTGPVAAIS
jgi:hypothetical protein